MSDDNDPCATQGHDKCYEYHVITTSPPQRRWICRRCLARGFEVVEEPPGGEEYYRLLGKLKGGHP